MTMRISISSTCRLINSRKYLPERSKLFLLQSHSLTELRARLSRGQSSSPTATLGIIIVAQKLQNIEILLQISLF